MTTDYRGLCVVGASGSGKTTLIRALHASESMVGIAFPLRVTTRNRRSDDRCDEQISVTPEAFKQMLRAGRLWLSWQKQIGESEVVYYGFEFPASPCVVLSGNSDLVTLPASVRPTPGVLAQFDLVLTRCDMDVRRARIQSRDPGLRERPTELVKRLADDTRAIAPQARYIVDTTAGLRQNDLNLLLARLDELK